jgi:metal-dependent hydrolase (beta-lactamase superfamily II)
VEAAKNAINKPLHLVLGGPHLLPAKDYQITGIAVALRETWGVRYIAPSAAFTVANRQQVGRSNVRLAWTPFSVRSIIRGAKSGAPSG